MAQAEAVAALVAAFERIAATRMAGLPLNNPALRVAALGFRPCDETHRVGVLVTPWAINLMLIGAAGADDLRLAPDRRRTWSFPAGRYDFMGGEEAECGPYQFCSLFSPAFEFPDQASAEAVAGEIMQGLFVGAEGEGEGEDARELARLSGQSPMQYPTSRRGFLRGVFGGLKA